MNFALNVLLEEEGLVKQNRRVVHARKVYFQ